MLTHGIGQVDPTQGQRLENLNEPRHQSGGHESRTCLL